MKNQKSKVVQSATEVEAAHIALEKSRRELKSAKTIYLNKVKREQECLTAFNSAKSEAEMLLNEKS